MILLLLLLLLYFFTSLTPIRLQLWRSCLNQYDFKTVLIKSELYIADYLSRCMKHSQKASHVDVEDAFYRINAIITRTKNSLEHIIDAASEAIYLSRDSILNATKNDEILSNIIENIKQNKRIPSNPEFKYFRCLEGLLTISASGLLMKEDKIVLPESLIPTAIDIAHIGHMGGKLCTRLLKKNFDFPLIEKRVNEKISSCNACDANTDTTKLNPILSSHMPNERWDLIAIYFSSRTPTGEYILVLVWEHSRYPILKLAKNLTSKETIKILNEVFQEFGIPKSIKSDNGPAFKTTEFSEYCMNMKITHLKVTPLWPRENGMS